MVVTVNLWQIMLQPLNPVIWCIFVRDITLLLNIPPHITHKVMIWWSPQIKFSSIISKSCYLKKKSIGHHVKVRSLGRSITNQKIHWYISISTCVWYWSCVSYSIGFSSNEIYVGRCGRTKWIPKMNFSVDWTTAGEGIGGRKKHKHTGLM